MRSVLLLHKSDFSGKSCDKTNQCLALNGDSLINLLESWICLGTTRVENQRKSQETLFPSSLRRGNRWARLPPCQRGWPRQVPSWEAAGLEERMAHPSWIEPQWLLTLSTKAAPPSWPHKAWPDCVAPAKGPGPFPPHPSPFFEESFTTDSFGRCR